MHEQSLPVIVARDGRRTWRFADGTELPVVSGGDGPTPESPPEDLSGTPVEELESRYEALKAEYDEKRPEATDAAAIEALSALVAQRKAVKDELNRRAEEAAEQQRRLEALDAEAMTLDDPGDSLAQSQAIAEGAEKPDEKEKVPEAQAAAPSAPEAPQGAPAPVAAGVSAAQIAEQRQAGGSGAAPQPAAPKHRLRLVASASQQVVAPGAEVDSADVGKIFARALRQRAAGVHGVHEQILATVPGIPADGDHLERSNVEGNDAKIAETFAARQAARNGEAMTPRTAAICGPLDIVREICGGQDTEEILSAIFPTRAAPRLGFQYTPAAHLTSVAGAVTNWTEAQQDLVDEDDSSTWKPCIDIECPTAVAVTLSETVGCVRVREDVQLSAPEKVEEVLRLVRVLAARNKTAQLLQRIKDTSIEYTGETVSAYGAYPTVVRSVMSLFARAGYDDRLDDAGQPYTLVVGPAFGEAITLDRLSRGFNPSDCESVAEVLACLQRSTGIDRVVDLNDVVADAGHPFVDQGGALPTTAGAVGGTAWQTLPTTFEVGLVPTESFLYSTTGEAETGLVSDPQLARQNRKQLFFREWWSLVKVCPAPSFWLNLTVCGNGARAALVTPDDCGLVGT